MDDKVTLDKFHWHEALVRTHMVRDLFYDFVLSHPAIEQDDTLAAQAEVIMGLLGDLYQSIAVHKEV